VLDLKKAEKDKLIFSQLLQLFHHYNAERVKYA
jgi:hypothetical protein